MILVFVGAGGSTAVNSEQYPTTVEFFNRLPDDIKQESLFTQIREFLETNKRGQPIDIEEVLWNLDELRGYFKTSCDTNAMPGWIMANQRINQLIGAPDLSNLLNGMRQLGEDQIRNLKDRINALVYGFYGRHPNDDELADWVQLFRGLAERGPVIEIFTTNYDVVLECAISLAHINVETGRSSNDIQMSLDTTFWDTPGEPIENKYGRLTKLHGSVDWQYQNGDIVVGNSNFTGDHQKHSILYPGYKGVPDTEPFRKFHEHLQEVVQKAEAAVFIGFSFRDEFINTILSDLQPQIPKLVINKDEKPSHFDLSFLTGCTHLQDGLTADSVESCISNLSPQFHFDHGNAKYNSNDYEGAVIHYNKVIQLAPQCAAAYYNRGRAKHESGDLQEAIVDYGEVIKRNPQDAQAYYYRGSAKNGLGYKEDAKKDLVKSQELDPSVDMTELGQIRICAATGLNS